MQFAAFISIAKSMAKAIIFGCVAILALLSKGQAQTFASSPSPVPSSTDATDVTEPSRPVHLQPSGQGCEERKSKYVNDTCKLTEDCNPSMVCRNGLCVCREPLIQRPDPDNKNRYTCRNGPTNGEQCTDVCAKPFTCAISEINPRPAGPVPGPKKICTCLPPAKMDNGVCRLDCKDDELFHNGECKKRCAVDEVRVDGAGCLTRSALDEKCADSRQCSTPFSECIEGAFCADNAFCKRCKCKPGFDVKNGKCESQHHTCPFGEPIMTNGTIKECSLRRKPPDLAFISASVPFRSPDFDDNCGQNEFCMVSNREEEGATGHCCPIEKTRCPVGEIHPNATCDQSSVGVNGVRSCPIETHYCYSKNRFSATVCCPTPCNEDTILVDGQCLPRLKLGDKCSSDVQCKGPSGRCIDGTCKCEGNLTSIGYCRTECGQDRVSYGDRCYPKRKLGETCQVGSSQCPANAHCSKKGICECRCEYQAIGDNICGPIPVCKQAQGDDPSSTTSPPRNGNATFCKVPGSQTPVPAVEECSTGETCSYYIMNLGLCCPTPKPICPTGETSDQKCDLNTPCGSGSFCYRYYSPANVSDSTHGYICCPGSPKPTRID